jgi:hypothetical protein
MAGMRSGYVQRNDALQPARRSRRSRADRLLRRRGLKPEYTLDLTAIGKPVRLDPPPAARVLDARKP